MTDQPSAATPMNAAAIPLNRVSASTPINATAIKPTNGSGKAILSVDLGRTSTKTCVSREPNSVVFVPANVKKMSIEQVRGGVFEARATDPLMDLWLEYQGNASAHHAVEYLPDVEPFLRHQQRDDRSRQPLPLANEQATARSRSHLGFDARSRGNAEPEDERPPSDASTLPG